MISAAYAAVLALLIVGLSFRVISLRRIKKISLGDGGDPELRAAIRAQGNAIEYIPISLILLVLLELGKASVVLVHVGGIAVLAGRFPHARGLLTEKFRYRVLGMQLTLFALTGLALANLVHCAYGFLLHR